MPLIQIDKGANQHSAIRLTVTTTEQMVPFPVSFYFDHIYNEGPDTIIIGIDEPTNGQNAIYLDPGQLIEGFYRTCNTLYARTVTGTAILRVLGV